MIKPKQILYRKPWIIILLALLVTGGFALLLPRLEIDPNINTMIPPTLDARKNTDRINEIFGSTDMMVILYQTGDVLEASTLKRIRETVRAIRDLPEVQRTHSLFDARDIRGEEGAMVVDPAVTSIPETGEERETLRERLRHNRMVMDKLVSPDFTMTAIFVNPLPDSDNNLFVEKVKEIVNRFPGQETVWFGGMPVMTATLSRDIAHNMLVLLPVALLLMIVMLYLAFRQLRGVVLPFSVVVMSIVLSMGLMAALGWKVTLLSILLPVMLIAIANDYGIHLIALYQEINAMGHVVNRKELIGMLLRKLTRPILLTGLTTIVGILGLLSHILLPARQLGILAATGIAFALMLSLLFIPAVLMMLKMPPPAKAKGSAKKHPLEKILARMARGIVHHPRRVLAGSALLLLVAAGGLFLVRVDANIENFFPKNHPVRISADLVNSHFGGSEDISVWFRGDIMDPAILQRMEQYQETLKNNEHVGNIVSIVDALHEMSKAINDPGDPYYDRIPDSREAVAQYFVLYSMSGDPEDFEQLVDFDYENAQILVRLNTGSTRAIQDVVREIRALTAGDPAFAGIGGYGYINARISDLIMSGQLRSLVLAILMVSLMVMLFFRSVPSGFYVALPLVAAILILFGLMGYAGIRLDVATAMLSSIMIGVGVDYSIHFIWRYRQERTGGKSAKAAIYETLTTTGRGIVFNGLSVVVGFSALLVSTFTPIRFFGFLVVVSITSCLAGALVVLPAMILVVRPKFLESALSGRHEKNVKRIGQTIREAI